MQPSDAQRALRRAKLEFLPSGGATMQERAGHPHDEPGRPILLEEFAAHADRQGAAGS